MALGWLGWRAWAGVAGVAAAAVGVAGVALCDIHLRFTWQAWYVVTSTFTLRGRRGTYGIGLAPVARLGRSGRGGRRGCWRGRRGTLRHLPWFHVAGVVLGDIDLHFAWQAWHVWHWAGVAAAAVGVAGMALCDIHLGFTWQAWYLVTSTVTLCGRRGTYGMGLAPVARLGRSGRGGRRGCWRGRRGTLPLHIWAQALHCCVCKIRQLDFFSTTSPNTLSMAPFAAVIVVVPQDLLSCTEAS